MTRRSQRPYGRLRFGAAALALLCGVLSLGCSPKITESQVGPCAFQLACGATCCKSGQICGANKICSDGAGGAGSGSDDPGRAGAFNSNAGNANTNIDVGNINPNAGGPGSEDACAKLAVTFTPQIPTVVMLVDQSGSMNQSFDTTGNRWNVLRAALVDPTAGIIATLQAKVRFGLALYTSDKGFGDSEPKRICPIITNVPPALNNLAAISAQYLPNGWRENGDTPTGESVDAAAKVLAGVTDAGPKVIVLATDGEPDSCTDPNPQNQVGSEAARQLSVSAVQNAFKDHITTFVISVGNEVGEAHLRAVANAGQGLAVDVDTTNRFYRANSQMDLKTAFDTIVNGVRSCVLELNGSVDAGSAGTGTVTLDGKALGYADANGWRLNSPTVVELQGTACDDIKSGDHALNIVFPCGVIVPK